MISVDDLSVALADLLIPEEGIFPASCEITGPVIMAVNVDKSIALCILR